MGISLWLMPRPGSPLFDALQSTIDGLRPLFDDARSFEPHVTITTGIQINSQKQVDWVLDRAQLASKAVPHINVEFDHLTYGSTFTKKVFFKVKKHPELVSLAQISREEFVCLPNRTSQTKNYNALPESELRKMEQEAAKEAHDWVLSDDQFMPHLSLVYSNAYPIDEAIRSTIEERLSDVFGNDFNDRGLGWTNGRLALVLCEGPVDEWRTLGYRDL